MPHSQRYSRSKIPFLLFAFYTNFTSLISFSIFTTFTIFTIFTIFSLFQTGDEMSKRAKFVMVTCIGPGVSVMKKAKMSTDKALMKDICQVKPD